MKEYTVSFVLRCWDKVICESEDEIEDAIDIYDAVKMADIDDIEIVGEREVDVDG